MPSQISTASKLLKTVRYINLYSTLLLAVELVLYINIIQVITVFVAVLSYVIETILEKKWQHFRWENSLKQGFFITIIFYFLLQFIFLSFEKNNSYFVRFLLERLPFLIFGVVGLLGVNKYYNLRLFAWAFIATSFFVGVFLLSHLNAEILSRNDRNGLFGLIRIAYVNSHMKFNYYLNLSLIFGYYLLAYTAILKNLRLKIAIAIGFVVIVLNLFLSDGRTGMLSSFVLLTVFIFRYFWQKSRLLTLISTTIFLLVAITLIDHNPRLSESNIKREPRQEIWRVSVEQVKASHFMGTGVSTNAYIMLPEYSKIGEAEYAHAHNVFLQSTLEYGVLGFVTILFLFFSAYYSVSSRFRFIMSLVCFITLAQLLVGDFEWEINPIVFLLVVILVVHQDSLDASEPV